MVIFLKQRPVTELPLPSVISLDLDVMSVSSDEDSEVIINGRIEDIHEDDMLSCTSILSASSDEDDETSISNANNDAPMFISTTPKHTAIGHSASTENIVGTPSPETEHLDNQHISHYKLVFDNINKTVTPRFQSLQSPRVTLNYVNMFAFKDRAVPSSHLSRVSRYFPTGLSKVEIAKAILPSCKDDESLKYNFSLIISRVLVQHFSFFNLAFNDVVDWHIKHKYYKETSMKSEVVS